MTKNSLIKIFFTFFIFGISSKTFAWGGRGHDTICEAAVHLVKNPDLKNFLQGRGYIMGHLCNIPDTEWRNLDAKSKAAGDPTHFVDPEIVGAIPKTLSLDMKALIKEHTGKQNQFDKEKKIFSVPREVGSNWWRVDQFMREIASLREILQTAATPKNKGEEQDLNLPYNKSIYRFMTMAGVLGHYVGDAAQPLHNTADYDGWAKGHGGLHSYYETVVVAQIDGNLQSDILKEAKNFKNAPWLQGSTLEKMQKFGQVAYDELPALFKLDPVLKKSEQKGEKGMSIRTPAQRKPASEVVAKMRPMIVTQMARSATLLAHLWDEAYANIGQPSLKEYQHYKHPFSVEFVFPDYE